MSRSSSSPDRPLSRGFSLIEVLVSLLILVIVMIVTVGLLFSMRSFAERQIAKTAPRQTARQAIDYLAFFAGGASDLNIAGATSNPNAIVTFWQDGGGNLRQASYNNLTGSETGNAVIGTGASQTTKFGDLGTDILTVAIPVNPFPIPVASWGGFNNSTTPTTLNYSAGCGTPTANDTAFKSLTGMHNDANISIKSVSDLLIAADTTGAWGYYRITDYGSTGNCNASGNFSVLSNPSAQAYDVQRPGGQPNLTGAVSLIAGIQFVSFRVRRQGTDANGDPILNLEQKAGIFNPSTDNPGTAFYPIVEDIEDLQVAWLYNQPHPTTSGGSTMSTVFNTGPVNPTTGVSTGPTLAGASVTAGVPTQNPTAPGVYEVTGIAGLRISVVARSKALRSTSRKMTERTSATRLNFRPSVEDRAAGPIDNFDHQRITTTVMLRNRMLGN